MRIERISETQVKFILTNEDFNNRGLSVSELTYNSEKAQLLFRDMLELAAAQTGFEVDQSPLMIEAMPLQDSIVIIVSKVAGEKDGVNASPLSSLFGRVSKMGALNSARGDFKSFQGDADGRRIRLVKNMAIYSFEKLDDATLASYRLNGFFRGASSLHKYDGAYYMCVQLPYKSAVHKMESVENILSEYGQRHISNTVSRGFLLEHGEALISSNAVGKLAEI